MSPSDPTVVLALDTNIQMMKENPLDVVMEDRHETTRHSEACSRCLR